jgi:hypothetical protein
MSSTERSAVAPLSMLFELAREDNPRLYDDLVRFAPAGRHYRRPGRQDGPFGSILVGPYRLAGQDRYAKMVTKANVEPD